MSLVTLRPVISWLQPAPVRLPLSTASVSPPDGLALVDEASGERFPAQPEGDRAVIALLGPLSGERRFRLEAAPAAPSRVTLARSSPHQVEVRIDGQLLTAYDCDPGNARPFFYPLIGPTGQSVTRHYPMQPDLPGEEHDHPHHRSMWSAYGEVNGTDNWSEGRHHARQIPEGEPELVSGPVFGRLTAHNRWVSPEGKAELAEERVVTFYEAGPDRRLFDYEITFTAAAGDVRFGDTKEGGILSFRVATSMDANKNGRIENGAGGVGERECWGKAAAWCDYSGPVAGDIVGIGVMDSPDNFRSPVHWHVRDYGLMTTNCFGDSAFAGEEGGHRGDHTLKAGQSLTFRYRVLLHRGHAAEGGVADAFAAYAHAPRLSVER